MDRTDSNNDNAKDRLRYRGSLSFAGLLINIIIALSSVTISGWCIYDIISQPFHSLRAASLIILTFTLAIATNRSFAILQRFVIKKKLRIGIGILKWLGTFLVPLFCVSIPNNIANNRSIEITRKQLAPLIEYIEREHHKLTYPPVDVLKGFQEISKFRQVVYYRGDKKFALSTYGGSIDIDGSTIYYNCLTQEWLQIHNDLIRTDRGEPFRKAIEGLDLIRYGFKEGMWKKTGSAR